jgi:hypothetical protein
MISAIIGGEIYGKNNFIGGEIYGENRSDRRRNLRSYPQIKEKLIYNYSTHL